MTHLQLKKGDYVIREGDAVNAGHLLFVASGELQALRNLPNGLQQELGFIQPGETFGELMFLLGGDPRASIVVTSETAEVLQLPRDRLRELLNNQAFAAKFWKYLCSVTSSRMNATQARFNTPPTVPMPCKFVVPPEEEVKAKSMGSIPALPELPPPAVDPKDELIMRIKQRGGFFLGVDVPSS